MYYGTLEKGFQKSFLQLLLEGSTTYRSLTRSTPAVTQTAADQGLGLCRNVIKAQTFGSSIKRSSHNPHRQILLSSLRLLLLLKVEVDTRGTKRLQLFGSEIFTLCSESLITFSSESC